MALTVNHPLLKEQTVSCGTASMQTFTSTFTTAPFRGTLVKLRAINHAALLTASSVVTVKINGTAVTGGVITISFTGSTAGAVTSVIPTALNAVSEDDVIEFAFTGTTTPGAATFLATIQAS